MELNHIVPVAITEAAFPRMIAREILCLKNVVSLFSPVRPEIRWPNSATKLLVDLPRTPEVSTAMGSKRYLEDRLEQNCLFLSSALVAAEPGLCAVSLMFDLQKVSLHVASHVKLLPLLKGKIVIPSGRLPSPLSSPTGSSHDGTPACSRDRLIISLRLECLGSLPALLRHERPCKPNLSAFAPHLHL